MHKLLCTAQALIALIIMIAAAAILSVHKSAFTDRKKQAWTLWSSGWHTSHFTYCCYTFMPKARSTDTMAQMPALAAGFSSEVAWGQLWWAQWKQAESGSLMMEIQQGLCRKCACVLHIEIVRPHCVCVCSWTDLAENKELLWKTVSK